MECLTRLNGGFLGIDRLFEQSWRAVQPNLRKRAQRLARGDRERAEEWLSNTALKALLFLRRAPERVRDPEGFMFLVLEHVYLDSARHHQRESRLFDHGVDLHSEQIDRFASPANLLERLEQLERLAQIGAAVARLPLPQQRLFELRFIEERPYADIADELGITQPLVRKRVQLLRNRLGDQIFSQGRSQHGGSRVPS
ncbi:RNA polymerase subunit sigma-70 [Pseudomonas sp. PIC25]|uniref:RNA polymerase sigma factor n=1 Tax=Pseudomonas sp. PIC25 TaxID=1958773 RepID=UPI000BABD07B|nr:sigma-70 family RNA polymerase sigma factor [Pseudomonas sp. PIC25]PAU65647.1 RNA polymerase subunit sigma-70 [Pseudomonas sp. PIC25]